MTNAITAAITKMRCYMGGGREGGVCISVSECVCVCVCVCVCEREREMIHLYPNQD